MTRHTVVASVVAPGVPEVLSEGLHELVLLSNVALKVRHRRPHILPL